MTDHPRAPAPSVAGLGCGPKRARRPLSRRKRWGYRAAVLLLVALLFSAAELSLRLVGFGSSLRLVVPVSGAPERLSHQLNSEVDRVYYGAVDLGGPEPRRFRLPKPPATFRVVIVGASTVIGYPYPPELAFPRHMEIQLERQSPGTDVEVLNAGITAVNSSAVRDVLAEAIPCDPDLIVVHCGHNEFYGPGGVASAVVGVPEPLVPLQYALRRQRLAQLVAKGIPTRRDGERDLIESLPRVLEIPADGELMRSAERVYRANLEQMVDTAREADVPILLTTVASNLKDQSPIRSVEPQGPEAAEWRRLFLDGVAHMRNGDWPAALESLTAAEQLDAENALLAFRKAQTLQNLGRLDAARERFAAARDLDACRFRAPGSFRRIVREVAEHAKGDEVSFLDLAAEVERHSAPEAPGHDLFLEHVHYTYDGHSLLGELLAQFVQSRILRREWDESVMPGPDTMEQALGAIPQDHLVALSFALETLRRPPLSGAADCSEHQAHLRALIARSFGELSPEEQSIFAGLSMQEMQTDLIGSLSRAYARQGFDQRSLRMAELGVIRQPWSAERHSALADALERVGQPARASEARELDR